MYKSQKSNKNKNIDKLLKFFISCNNSRIKKIKLID
jgi:hypothetical protein